MRPFHYIEVWEPENERMPLARFQTNQNRFQEEWLKYKAMYPEYRVESWASSEKERVFNHIKQTA